MDMGGQRRIVSMCAAGAAGAALCLTALPARAQESRDTIPAIHVHHALGLRLGTPQRASVAIGAVFGSVWRGGPHPRTPEISLVVEPGLSAGRASLGLVTYGKVGSGFGISGTVLRTWRDSWVLPDNESYVGVEAWVWPLFHIGPRVGAFHGVKNSSLRGWRLTADIGWGF
jgi:hypothetical protein